MTLTKASLVTGMPMVSLIPAFRQDWVSVDSEFSVMPMIGILPFVFIKVSIASSVFPSIRPFPTKSDRTLIVKAPAPLAQSCA